MLTTAHHLSLSWATRIQCAQSHPICLEPISTLSFHPFLFLPRSPFPSRPHDGLLSPTDTSSTIGTSIAGTDGHHSKTHHTHSHHTCQRCRSSRQYTLHCATDVTCSYRPIASDSHRVWPNGSRTSRSNDHIRGNRYSTWPDHSAVEGEEALSQILELSFGLQPSCPEQWFLTEKS